MSFTETVEVRRHPQRLVADSSRVVAQLFVPGQEGPMVGESRAGPVVQRILALDDREVDEAMAEVAARFRARHRDLDALLDEHFELVAHRVPEFASLPVPRRRLIGAYFTQEIAVEAAAVCNPSMVAHPDQRGVGAGDLRFAMSVRAVGEGHRSSIEFRTGVVGADGDVRVEPPAAPLVSGRPVPMAYRRDLFHRVLRAMDDDLSSAAYVLDSLPDPFTALELDDALHQLSGQLVTRRGATRTIDRIRRIAASNYGVDFPPDSLLSQRVLLPTAPTEAAGMEDARWVRFCDDDGTVTYHATYTAWDGEHIAVQLLTTTDFVSFTSTQLTGQGAANKGMALFPRRIGGRYAALSRWDRATNSVVMSDDLGHWDHPASLVAPRRSWDLVQLGNCGSPIATPAGWLALTHGVGPMRRYVIGAELLDIDDPTRVIASLTEPLVTPAEDERDGYVPNVVYSCGALLHGDRVVIPVGLGDASIRVVTVSLDQLLDRLTSSVAAR